MIAPCLFFCCLLLLIHGITAVRIYHIALHPDIQSGPAYSTGRITLTYTHAQPPITIFEEDRSSRWRGPPAEIILEPDDRQGEFFLFNMMGKHTPEGLEIKNEFYNICVKQNARISIQLVNSQVQSISLSHT